jgi:S1-C subfamily serine protease
MVNKIFIGLFVVLFAACGCFGYYTYQLNDQLNTLNKEQQAFEQNTANNFVSVHNDIAELNTNLTTFQANTESKFTGVQNKITDLNSQFGAYKADTDTRLGTLQTNIDDTNLKLDDLAASFSETAMNVRALYENVVKGVCMVVSDTGQGSGFIFNSQGYVVTCNHVVEGASIIIVKLHDGRIIHATFVGSDEYADIAVLRLYGVSDLTPLDLANSRALTGGEPVMVVGNPLGIFESVTYGVVSQVDSIVGVTGFTWLVSNLIQFDAPANPGNSGGPVINKDGQVIGITAYSDRSYEGIHFAISSNRIKRVAQAIINSGSFTDATLPGHWVAQDLTPDQAYLMGLSTSFGVWIQSASGAVDLLADDVIVGINGVLIKDEGRLFAYIGEFSSPGDTVTLMVIRDHVQISVEVNLVAGFIPVS